MPILSVWISRFNRLRTLFPSGESMKFVWLWIQFWIISFHYFVIFEKKILGLIDYILFPSLKLFHLSENFLTWKFLLLNLWVKTFALLLSYSWSSLFLWFNLFKDDYDSKDLFVLGVEKYLVQYNIYIVVDHGPTEMIYKELPVIKKINPRLASFW